MRIIHLNYTLARPKITDPEKWLERTSFVNGVIECMSPYGEMIAIYNIHFKGELRKNNVRYIFPGLKRWQLVLPFKLNRIIAALKPDAVLVHGLRFPWQVTMLRWACGPELKIIVQHHAEVPFADFRKFLFRISEKYVGAYLFASKEQGEIWVKTNHISSIDKVHEIIGTSSVFQPGVKSIARTQLNINSKFVFLWIGDLNSNKDPLLAVKAFKRFAASRNDVSMYMIFQSNALESQLKELITTGVPVHLVGRVDHHKLQAWYSAADFIVSTSHYEGSGVAVMEAMSCGCIPIVSHLPSFRRMTDNHKLGFSFDAGDEDGLTQALTSAPGVDIEIGSSKTIAHFNRELSFVANARKIMDVFNGIGS